jgi:benzoate-CoA ligase family protein
MTAASISLPEQFNAATYFIDRNYQRYGEKLAIESDAGSLTYGELYEKVNRFGNALRSLKVRIEERVFLLLFDCPEFAVSFFGAIKIGAVPVPVNTLLKPADYQYLLNQSRARVAVISEALFRHFQAMPRRELRYLEHVIVVGQSEELKFSDLVAQADPELEAALTSRDDAAFWLCSSGSTGPPKACVHLQHDMVVCAERYAKGVLRMTSNDRCFSASKLFFAYGLGNALYFPFAVGATSILASERPRPELVFETIKRHRPTLFFSVPSNFAALLAHAERCADCDLSSVRNAVSAGEALPAPIFHRFRQRFGVEILDAIGSTEALHMFIANRPGAARPGSSGQIIEGYDAKIVDEEDHPVPEGEIGNLLIRSDAVCSHYWNRHEQTKNTIAGHWSRTGDKYYRDADGYFWYAGRSDDMFKCSGAWVSPVEIESVLMEHPEVQEAAVIGREDQDALLKPMACVVLKNGNTGDPELARQLQELVLSRLPAFKRPRWTEFLPELPRTATGKLQRYKLREHFKGGPI